MHRGVLADLVSKSIQLGRWGEGSVLVRVIQSKYVKATTSATCTAVKIEELFVKTDLNNLRDDERVCVCSEL